MAATIRIDDEVYEWLQRKARPFEDTPNSVLRRIAGFDTEPIKSSQPAIVGKKQIHSDSERLSGKNLQKQWGVSAQDVRYHQDGHFYENVTKFPAAFFDPNGYALFKTEADLRNTPKVKIGKKTNIRGGIASLNNYIRMK